MGGKRILKVENILLPNSNARPVIPQVFHKQIGIYSHALCMHTIKKGHTGISCVVYILCIYSPELMSLEKKNILVSFMY